MGRVMTPAIAKNVLVFLGRVPVTGQEAFALVEAIQAVGALTEAVPAATAPVKADVVE